MSITNISIKNIKGYGDPATSFDLELKTNRVNIIYAPNGSGKSSLAIAFSSLLPRSLKVEKDNMHFKDETLDAELKVTLDGEVLVANKTKNEISRRLNVYVVNAGLTPGTIQHNTGHFTTVSGYLDIEDIELESNIPVNVLPVYHITNIRQTFGTNSKILPSIKLFGDKNFWMELENNAKLLSSFYQSKKRKQLIDDVIANIGGLRGTADEIVSKIPTSWFSNLEANQVYQSIISAFSSYFERNTPLCRFFLIFQILHFWNNNKDIIHKANKRTIYDNYKKQVDSNLSFLDLTWRQIHTEEKDGKLLVRFPHADEISNGQRDLLTFILEMLKYKKCLNDGKKHLLIIDEVFDYLDDANIIAAQCFLTDFLKSGNNNLYLCILTHLNPFSFKNYIFSDDKVNHVYLYNTNPTATLEMKAFIAFRQGLDRKNDPVQVALYDKISHDLFHYNPVGVDYSVDIATHKRNQNLKQTWGKTSVLHSVLIDEVNKYLSNSPSYDPYAVAMATRLRIEKLMYDQLPTQALKNGFLNEKTTKNKMKYCNVNGNEMPEVYNLANAIHNEADHLVYDVNNNRYIEKTMVYKLQNQSIKNLIARLFGWNGTKLTTAIID